MRHVIRLDDNTTVSSINEDTDFTCAQSEMHLENITPFEQMLQVLL
jgi:hypothetical protein